MPSIVQRAGANGKTHLGECASWSQAVKHMLCIHVLCGTCKWWLCAYATDIRHVANITESIVGQTIMTMMLIVIPLALVWFATSMLRDVFTPVKEEHRLLHNHHVRTITLMVAAAQASTLLCVDWATAFYVLSVLVPLLGFSVKSGNNMAITASRYIGLSGVVLTLYMCFTIVTSQAFEPLFRDLHLHASKSYLPSVHAMTSWHSTCLSSLLATLLPGCLINI